MAQHINRWCLRFKQHTQTEQTIQGHTAHNHLHLVHAQLMQHFGSKSLHSMGDFFELSQSSEEGTPAPCEHHCDARSPRGHKRALRDFDLTPPTPSPAAHPSCSLLAEDEELSDASLQSESPLPHSMEAAGSHSDATQILTYTTEGSNSMSSSYPPCPSTLPGCAWWTELLWQYLLTAGCANMLRRPSRSMVLIPLSLGTFAEANSIQATP